VASSFAKLKALQQATQDYVATERKRLQNEAAVLKSILARRGPKSGLSDTVAEQSSAAAAKDLATFLSGK
jgi:hypothetical protein